MKHAMSFIDNLKDNKIKMQSELRTDVQENQNTSYGHPACDGEASFSSDGRQECHLACQECYSLLLVVGGEKRHIQLRVRSQLVYFVFATFL